MDSGLKLLCNLIMHLGILSREHCVQKLEEDDKDQILNKDQIFKCCKMQLGVLRCC